MTTLLIGGCSSSEPAETATPRQVLYFPGDDGTTGFELWKTDGTAAGTALVKDINPAGDSWPFHLGGIGSVDLFAADNGTYGILLWKSDGTPDGTALLKDVVPGEVEPVVFNGKLYFDGDEGVGLGLYGSDGTRAGTTLLKDINEDADDGIQDVVVFKSRLFFGADDGVNGNELWTSDGTEPGTTLFKDISAAGSGFPGGFAVLGDTLLFQAYDDTTGRELWASDGTPGGTQLLKDINPTGESGPANFAQVGDELYFTVFNTGSGPNIGRELWKTDGSSAGTVLVKHFGGLTHVAPRVGLNGMLFFHYADEIWISDGTDPGTHLFVDTNPSGLDQASIIGLLGNHLYFRADDGLHGVELWVTDGSDAGTHMVKDINPSGGSWPYPLDYDRPVLNGMLIFAAYDPVHGFELWRSDGTEGGTEMYFEVQAGAGNGLPD